MNGIGGRLGARPNSAVYEYLDGRRQVGSNYFESMLAAPDLEVRSAAET